VSTKMQFEKKRRQRKNILAFFSGDRTPPMEIVERAP
jgi:hypothetical protein